MKIAKTWIFSFGFTVFIWFFYLIFIANDNTIKKIWRTIRPETSKSNSKFIKWFIFLLMVIISIYFSYPSLYSNINALKHQTIFEGKAILKENQKNSDNRFINVYVKNGNNKYEFQGKSKEIRPLLESTIDISIYQGVFSKYALIKEKP